MLPTLISFVLLQAKKVLTSYSAYAILIMVVDPEATTDRFEIPGETLGQIGRRIVSNPVKIRTDSVSYIRLTTRYM